MFKPWLKITYLKISTFRYVETKSMSKSKKKNLFRDFKWKLSCSKILLWTKILVYKIICKKKMKNKKILWALFSYDLLFLWHIGTMRSFVMIFLINFVFLEFNVVFNCSLYFYLFYFSVVSNSFVRVWTKILSYNKCIQIKFWKLQFRYGDQLFHKLGNISRKIILKIHMSTIRKSVYRWW